MDDQKMLKITKATMGEQIAMVEDFYAEKELRRLKDESREVKISISHDGEYATAIAMAAEDEAYDSVESMKKLVRDEMQAKETEEKAAADEKFNKKVKKIVRDEIRAKEHVHELAASTDIADIEGDAGAILKRLGG